MTQKLNPIKIISAILFSCLLSVNARSQSNLVVVGLVLDSLKTPVAGATIRAYPVMHRQDSQVVMTSNTGTFRLKFTRRSGFIIKVNSLGYAEYKTALLSIPDGDTFRINNIVLKGSAILLNDVQVAAAVPAVVVKTDTIEFKADSFRVKAGDDVEALLKKLPGFKVNRDGSILAHGKSVTKIKVNGKDFFGNGTEAASKNIPADMVDKVQLIDDYGETANFTGFKTGNSDKIINIQLKKNKAKGTFGKEELGAGHRDKYSVRLGGNRFTDKSQFSALFVSNNIGNNAFYESYKNYGSLTQINRINNKAYDQMGGVAALSSIVANGDMGFFANPLRSDGVGTNTLGGLNYSYDHQKVKLYSSILLNANDYVSERSEQGRIFAGTDENQTSQHNLTESSGMHARAFINTEYKIDAGSSIGLNLSGSRTTDKRRPVSESKIEKDGSVLNALQQEGNNYSNPDAGQGKIIYKKKFNKSGRTLVMEGQYSYTDQLSRNALRTLSRQPVASDVLQLDTSRSYFQNMHAFANYTEPFFKYFQLNVNAGARFNKSNELRNLYSYAGGAGIKNPTSGAYLTEGLLKNASAGIRFSRPKFSSHVNINWQSLNYRNIGSTGAVQENSQSFLAPQFSITFNSSKTSFLSLNYASSIQQPSAQQLSRYTDSINPFSVHKGNPDLQPEKKANLSLLLNRVDPLKGYIYVVSAGLQMGRNKIISTIDIDANGKQVYSYTNAPKESAATYYYNLSRPFLNKVLELTLSGNGNFSRSYYYHSAKQVAVSTNRWSQVLQLTVNPSVDGEINAGLELNKNGYTSQKHSYKSFILSPFIGLDYEIHKNRILMNVAYNRFSGFLGADGESSFVADLEFQRKLWKSVGVKASIKDIFNASHTNIARSMSATGLRDAWVNVLGRVYLLTCSYSFSKIHK